MPILWPRFFRKTYVTFLGLARRGIGFAAKAFLHAEFRPGVQLIADLSD